MLTLSQVCGGYGDTPVLFDVSLTVDPGVVLALVGRNGAGKSTTFKTICGQLPCQAGEIKFQGELLNGLPPYRVARLGVGYVPEDRQVFTRLTVHDNILLGTKAARDGARIWTESSVYETFPPLARLKRRMAGNLSGGEQQMLTIARTLMGNPSLILLDEPSEGLAPIVVASIVELVRRVAESGVTVVMAEQNIAFCMKVATHAAIIERGQIVYHDTMAALAADDEIKRRHLAV